jgi:hypothetical protein
MSLNQPQYNSTLKLIKRLDDFQLSSNNNNNNNNNKLQQQLNESDLEKINEKASCKLNLKGPVYNGLVSVEPDEEDFLKFLEIKHKHKLKPSQSANNAANQNKASNQTPPDLMEYYPHDLIKEFPEVNIDSIKPSKYVPLKASVSLINDPIEKYFKWN